jgi:hypothetical protein
MNMTPKLEKIIQVWKLDHDEGVRLLHEYMQSLCDRKAAESGDEHGKHRAA